MLGRLHCDPRSDTLGWGCRKSIARQIREQGADFVLCVQANRQGLHDCLEDTFGLERAARPSPTVPTTMRTRSQRTTAGLRSAAAGRSAIPAVSPMSTPTGNGAAWPAWSGARPNFRCGPCVGMEYRKCLPLTGSWTLPLAKTTTASARATRPTTCFDKINPQGEHRPQATGGRLE